MLGASLVMLGAQPSLGSDDRGYREEIQDTIAATRTQMHSPHEQEKVFDHQKGRPSRKSEDLPAVENQGPWGAVAGRAVQCIGNLCARVGQNFINNGGPVLGAAAHEAGRRYNEHKESRAPDDRQENRHRESGSQQPSWQESVLKRQDNKDD